MTLPTPRSLFFRCYDGLRVLLRGIGCVLFLSVGCGPIAFGSEATLPKQAPVNVDFDAYDPGLVEGQGEWFGEKPGDYEAWEVVPSPDGKGQSLKGLPGLRYRQITRTFSDEEIGGALLDSSRLLFRFDYYASDAICGYKVQRVAIGGKWGSAPSFQPRGDTANLWRYNSGGKDYVAKDSGGQDFNFLGQGWVTISGEIDFAQRKYTLFVGDVQQFGPSEDGWLDFPDSENQELNEPTVSLYVDGIDAPIHIDNIGLRLAE